MDKTAMIMMCILVSGIGFLSGMNNYLSTHTLNPYEAKNCGITLVEPGDPQTAKIWHKKYDQVIKELQLPVYSLDGKLISK